MRLAEGTAHEQEVREYVNVALNETNEERGNAEKPKTGVALGRTVTNPVNGEQIPMYVADYVLMEYGTGAIMAVPAHDERDYAFARAFELPIRRVIEPAGPGGRDGRTRRPRGAHGPRTPQATTWRCCARRTGRSKGQRRLRRFAFNTAIAAVMELLNDCSRLRDSVERRDAALRAGDAPRRCCSRSRRTSARTSTSG